MGVVERGVTYRLRQRFDLGRELGMGLPLIVLTVVFHAYGLELLNKEAVRLIARNGFRISLATRTFS